MRRPGPERLVPAWRAAGRSRLVCSLPAPLRAGQLRTALPRAVRPRAVRPKVTWSKAAASKLMARAPLAWPGRSGPLARTTRPEQAWPPERAALGPDRRLPRLRLLPRPRADSRRKSSTRLGRPIPGRPDSAGTVRQQATHWARNQYLTRADQSRHHQRAGPARRCLDQADLHADLMMTRQVRAHAKTRQTRPTSPLPELDLSVRSPELRLPAFAGRTVL